MEKDKVRKIMGDDLGKRVPRFAPFSIKEPRTTAEKNIKIPLGNINDYVTSFAGDISEPVLNALVTYLASQGKLPLTDVGWAKSAGLYDSEKNEVLVIPQRIGITNVLAHELNHAADNALVAQARRHPNTQFAKMMGRIGVEGESYKPNSTMFLEHTNTSFANKLDPDWVHKNYHYRATPHELTAWAVGNASTPYDANYDTPLHLDPTIATQQMLLLEAATREAHARQAAELDAEVRRPPKTFFQRIFK